MHRLLKLALFLPLFLFILPALLHLAVWTFADRPRSWHSANWDSAGILPAPATDEAAIYLMSARTGGLKGAFASHSWVVIKKPGSPRYDRYDVVGWGSPVRKNGYPADGRWYSNEPRIHASVSGQRANELIPLIENAISTYRWRQYGDYRTWPGPNSNTFVATVTRDVRGLEAAVPATAVGRDFPADDRWIRFNGDTLFATLGGYAGFVLGRSRGFEINFLGLVAGINPFRGEVKIPAFGSYSLW